VVGRPPCHLAVQIRGFGGWSRPDQPPGIASQCKIAWPFKYEGKITWPFEYEGSVVGPGRTNHQGLPASAKSPGRSNTAISLVALCLKRYSILLPRARGAPQQPPNHTSIFLRV
jgi:hypothetical protein